MILEFGARDDLPMRIAVSATAESITATLGPLVGGRWPTCSATTWCSASRIGFLAAACCPADRRGEGAPHRPPRRRSTAAGRSRKMRLTMSIEARLMARLRGQTRPHGAIMRHIFVGVGPVKRRWRRPSASTEPRPTTVRAPVSSRRQRRGHPVVDGEPAVTFELPLLTTPLLETERLILRLHRAEDVPAIQATFSATGSRGAATCLAKVPLARSGTTVAEANVARGAGSRRASAAMQLYRAITACDVRRRRADPGPGSIYVWDVMWMDAAGVSQQRQGSPSTPGHLPRPDHGEGQAAERPG